MANRLCLVLTSTIRVEHPEFLRSSGRIDSTQRMADCVTALSSWLTQQKSIERIVFIDNSGHSLDELREVSEGLCSGRQQVEFLSLKTEGYTKSKGRSYGELDILQHGILHSSLLADCTHFAKANARIFVPNFDKIVSQLPSDFDIVGSLSHNLTWLDTVFVFVRKSLFAERLLPSALQHVDDTNFHYIERVLAQEALRCIADEYRWYPFPAEPLLRGVRGLDSKPYPSGRLRAALIDLFGWGYHRARDNTRSSRLPHSQARWSKGDDPDESSDREDP